MKHSLFFSQKNIAAFVILILSIILISAIPVFYFQNKKRATVVPPQITGFYNTPSAPSENLPSQTPAEIDRIPIASPPAEFQTGKVTYVFDGDTIELSGGQRVRYIGINTPELGRSGSANQCFAAKSAEINKQLVLGQTVKMAKDTSETDKYGRLLRYIWVDDVFINDFLIRQGFARLETVPPDRKYASEFARAQAEAIQNKRGLWKECLY